MKAIKIATYILFCIVFAGTIAVAFFAYNYNARIFGRSFVTVLTGSMEPDVKTGALIIVHAPPPARDLRAGDVITFRIYRPQDGMRMVITHEIFAVLQPITEGDEITFHTKGRANPGRDPWVVRYGDIIGFFPEDGTQIAFLGNLLAFLAHPIGLLTMTLIFIVIIVSTYLFNKTNTRSNEVLLYAHSRAKLSVERVSKSLASGSGIDEITINIRIAEECINEYESLKKESGK